MTFINDGERDAGKVCDQLRVWLAGFAGPEQTDFDADTYVTMTVGYGVLIVEIGEWVVWCSESDSYDDLNFAWIKATFQRRVRALAEVLDD